MAQMSNNEILRQQAEALGEKVNALDREDLPTANIIVAGITGTGKSTLINSLFGSDVAKEGSGRPITENICYYYETNNHIGIWDTRGFELDSEKTRTSIHDIRQLIAGKAKLNNQFDRIHAIWYCVLDGATRYQNTETDFVKTLYELGVPFIIVITQSIGDDEFANTVRDINKSIGIGEIEVIPVLAKDYNVKIKEKLVPVEAFGLYVLVNKTIEKLPEFIKSGFIAAQRVDVVLKRSECEKIIIKYSKAVEDSKWDSVPIVRLFTTYKKINIMFELIGKLYNTAFTPEDINKLTSLTKQSFLDLLEYFFDSKSEYSDRLKELLEGKCEGLNITQYGSSEWKKAARVIIVCGYIYMSAIEDIWHDATEEQLKDIDYLIDQLKKRINKNLLLKRLGSKHNE